MLCVLLYDVDPIGRLDAVWKRYGAKTGDEVRPFSYDACAIASKGVASSLADRGVY